MVKISMLCENQIEIRKLVTYRKVLTFYNDNPKRYSLIKYTNRCDFSKHLFLPKIKEKLYQRNTNIFCKILGLQGLRILHIFIQNRKSGLTKF